MGEIQGCAASPLNDNENLRRVNHHYSLAQLCELSEQKRVMALMSKKEKVHIEAHSGQHHLWVTQLPLSFKKYALTSSEWITATRRRLMVNVFPFHSHCTFCKGGWCDVEGNHAIMCGGGHSRILRHNTLRDILAKAAREVGFSTDLEHGGGLGDERRPGDVIIYNWREGRHLLIDVAVTNPMCSTNLPKLLSDGEGAAATAYVKIKEKTYRDLDFTKYELLPFIVETSGGMGKAAHGFCKELKRLRESLNCNHDPDGAKRSPASDPVLVAISVELQRANCRMILERAPCAENLIESEIVKCEQSVSIKREEAIESLRLEALQPDRILNCNKGRKSREKFLWESEGTLAMGKSSAPVYKPQKFTRNPTNEKKKPISPCINSWQKLKVKWKTPPVPPKPPDGQTEIEDQSGRRVLYAVEERHKAPKSSNSQVTSTSLEYMDSTLNNKLEPIPWEPPIEHESKSDNEQGSFQ